MLRPKRQRTTYSQQQQQHHHHHHNSADEYGSGHRSDDERMPMNPSMMTERQQLAFLLRKTAQEASESDSLHYSDSSGEEETTQSLAEGAHLLSRGNAKSLPQSNTNANNDGGNVAPDESTVVYRGRGRPPKNAMKLHAGQYHEGGKTVLTSLKSATKIGEVERRRSDHEYSMNQSESRVRKPKKLKVATQSADSQSKASRQSDKSSPSSSSDVLLMDAFGSDGSGDFWSLHCALCCSNCEAVHSADALFLCPSCDQKYPTQRALGRV